MDLLSENSHTYVSRAIYYYIIPTLFDGRLKNQSWIIPKLFMKFAHY